MKYVIMADGKGTRWHNHNNIPKHFIEIDGEKLIERTIRLIHEADSNAEVIITSHDSRYEFTGSRRYEPKNNVLEIDRFTSELIEDNICFLYGDTLYSDEVIKCIVNTKTEDMMFFGNERSIVAIKVADGELFRSHVGHVRQLYLDGKIEKCIGWQVYQSFLGLPFNEKRICDKYIYVADGTRDFNTPEDFENGRKDNI